MPEVQDAINVFEDVTLEIDGKYLAVSGFSITLDLNGIPSITVSCVPIFSKEPPKEIDQIQAMTFNEFLSRHQDLVSLCSYEPEAISSELKFTYLFDVNSDGKASTTKTISIKDWVVVSAGIRRVAAQQPFQSVVLLQHPLYLATLSQLKLLNTYFPDKPMTESAVNSAENLAVGILTGFNNYLEFNKPEKFSGNAVDEQNTNADNIQQSIKDIDNAMWTRCSKALGILRKYITWDKSLAGFPAEGEACSMSVQESILQGFDLTNAQLSGDLYSVFLTTILEFGLYLQVDPFEGTQTVKAFNPWHIPDIGLPTYGISACDLPAVSLQDAAGVVIEGLVPDNSPDTVTAKSDITAKENKLQEQVTILAGYISSLSSENKITGGILTVAPPGWLKTYLYGGKTNDGKNTTETLTRKSKAAGNGEQLQNQAGIIERYQDFVTLGNKYCHDFFFIKYRAGRTVSVLTPFWPDKTTLPGNVVVVSEDAETSYFRFMITRVTHTVDLQQKDCFTNLEGSYVVDSSEAKSIFSKLNGSAVEGDLLTSGAELQLWQKA